jgi:MFS family permease
VTDQEAPTRSLWRDTRFRRFWLGQTLSQFGDRISELALPLIAVVLLDASAGEVGLLTAAVWGPNVVSLFVGSWVDQRMHKRLLLIAADLARALVLLTVPLAYVLDALTLEQLYAVALLTGLGQVLFSTAYPPFFVALVRRDQFLDANSKLSASRSASFVAGPAVAGGLVQLVTAPGAILVDAATYLVSAIQIGRVRVDERTVESAEGQSLVRRARQGLAFVLRHPILGPCLGGSTTLNFFTLMANALLVLYASRELGLSAGVIGLALGVGAVGGLVGAVLAPRIAGRLGVGPTILAGAVLFPAPIALLALASGPTWAAAALLGVVEFVSALGVMLYDVNQNALQASVTPDAIRSRVAGAYSTINYGIRPFGALVGGFLGETIGLRPTFVLAAVGGVLSVLWLLPSPVPGVRSLADADAPAGSTTAADSLPVS